MAQYKTVICNNSSYDIENHTRNEGKDGWRVDVIRPDHADPKKIGIQFIKD